MLTNPFVNPSAGPGGFKPSIRIDAVRGRWICIDPTGPGEPRNPVPVPVGTHLILDAGMILFGAVVFTPKFKELLAPLGAKEPVLPANAENEGWQAATRTQCLVEGFGLRALLITGTIALNAMSQIHQLFTYRREAQEGRLAVYRIREFVPVTVSYGVFHAPVLELIDFVDRNIEIFGPRITPPPPPILGGSIPPKQLRSTGNGAAPQVAANDPEPPAANDPAPPEADPFAAYRPVGGGKKPY
jgi:hypothetical protein